MSKADDLFFKEFGAILVALTVFGFAMYFLANYIGGGAFSAIQNTPTAVAERIAPVGRVRLDGEAVPVAQVAAAAAAPTAVAGKSGEEVYNAACVACHAAGVAGAPKLGDEAAWQTRFAQGLDALVASSIKGKGAMPAKGGNASLSDEEIHRAVVHMLSASGMDVPAGESAAPAAETAPAQQAAAEPAPAASAAPAPAAAPDTAIAAPATEATASAGRPGEEVYKLACLACHVAGVAGAPKTGDNAAWSARAGAGVDALVATVVKGKGAMPARGGNASLSEDDIRNAVVYLLEQAGVEAGGSSAAATPAAAPEQPAAASTETAPPAGAAAPAVASAGKPGDQVYNMACMACHVAGVAGAPKTGDKAAWGARAGTGVDALVASVLKGKGAMPPKGGNASLSEDDVRNAVTYMLEQAGVSG